jgi:nitrite reductase/ring-hydroxylating ferredoxin subunit
MVMKTVSMPVGNEADVKPGEIAGFDVGGVRIAVANAGGRLYAFDEMCTHEQCSLVEDGSLDGTVVTCGCHGAQFDVTTGAVLAPPAFEPLKVYPVHVDKGRVVVQV